MTDDQSQTVLVCGGRDYEDIDRVYAVLDGIHAKAPIASIIHGGAKGADKLAGSWAFFRDLVPERIYRANWADLGKAAGPLRNQQMLDKEAVDLVIAFPGGRGTADMVRRARKAGVPVREIQP